MATTSSVIPSREVIVLCAGILAFSASAISVWLISKHQQHMTNVDVQSKIVGIIWMVPIYSVDSFFSLWFPQSAIYINMLRDCYEAYVLYLFLSLMLSYLGCEEDDYAIVTYLTKKKDLKLPFPLYYFCRGELPKGRNFLRYCKFGTLQYCVVRPTTTLLSIILELAGAYHETNLSFKYGYIYILFIINISVAYAFTVLATFYSALKSKLKPFEPVGKFLCIKFVIFFAFWQSLLITGMVHLGWIQSSGGFSANTISTELQDFLICAEMLVVSVAHLQTFSYRPFTQEYRNEQILAEKVLASSHGYDFRIGKLSNNSETNSVETTSIDGSDNSDGSGSNAPLVYNRQQQLQQSRNKRFNNGKNTSTLHGLSGALRKASQAVGLNSETSQKPENTPEVDEDVTEVENTGSFNIFSSFWTSKTSTNNGLKYSALPTLPMVDEAVMRETENENEKTNLIQDWQPNSKDNRANTGENTILNSSRTRKNESNKRINKTNHTEQEKKELVNKYLQWQKEQKNLKNNEKDNLTLNLDNHVKTEDNSNLNPGNPKLKEERKVRFEKMLSEQQNDNNLPQGVPKGAVSLYNTKTNQILNKNDKVSRSILEKHFATSSAIRDFNESMPVLVLPSNFAAKKGEVVLSDPQSRLREAGFMEDDSGYNVGSNSNNAGFNSNSTTRKSKDGNYYVYNRGDDHSHE